MRDVELKYGTGTVVLRDPEERIAGHWGAWSAVSEGVDDAEAARTVPASPSAGDGGTPANGVASDPIANALRELADAGFADATRDRHLGLLVAGK